MAYTWVSNHQTNTTSGRHRAAVPLTSVSSNEVLRRVICEFYIDVVNPAQEVIVPWSQYGILSLIEATSGNPPPTPVLIGSTTYDNRDILYSRYDTFGHPAVFFTNWYRVPGDGMVGRIDVEISRRPDPDPLIIWWNWGMPSFGGGGVEVGFDRVWSRCLLESP